MVRRLKLMLVIAGVSHLSSGTSQAQPPQQTPENAQRFIAATLPGRMEAGSIGDGRRTAVTRLAAPTWSADYCTTAFRVRFELLGDGGFEHLLRWPAVAEVQHRDDSLTVAVVMADGHRTAYFFNYDAASLAARAAFAMEFLRQHCDPTAGTGF